MAAPKVLLVTSEGKAAALGQARLDDIVAAMAPAQVTLVKTSNSTELQAMLRREAAAFDCVAIAGGDGALNAAAQVLQGEACPLAVIPLGTANDLARSLDIPADPLGAAALVREGEVRRIDLGEVNGHFFFNVASIGLSADVAERLSGSDKRWGMLSYILAAADVWRTRRRFRVRITCDGASISMRAVQVSVGNGRYHGGGILVAEDAAVDDGLFDIYALEPQPLWRLIVLLPALLAGRQRYWKTVTTLRGSDVLLETRRRLRVNADGELVTRTPARFRIHRGAITVFAPRT